MQTKPPPPPLQDAQNSQGLATTHLLLLEGSGGGAGAMGTKGEPVFEEHDDECAAIDVDETDDGRLIRFEPPFDG